MAGRGPETFKKLQRERQRKEKQQEKIAKRLQRKQEKRNPDDLGPEVAERGEEDEAPSTSTILP
jgi:hypothetical protein